MVLDYLKRKGLLVKQNNINALSAAKTIVKLYNEGKTLFKIDSEINLSPTIVVKVLKKIIS